MAGLSNRGNHINWNHVFLFYRVAACGSIKDAASQLDLSTSTLSQHVSQLEKELDVLLFHRHHRKLELTQQGSRLFQYAKQMFETGQRLIDAVSPISLGCYPVTVGLVPNPSIKAAHQFMCDYVERHGPLNMKFFHAKHRDLESGLADSKFDFGFTDRMPERKDLVSRTFVNSELRFYAAKDIASKNLSTLVSTLPFLVCSDESSTRSLLERELEETDFSTPISTMTSDHPSLLLEMCERGLGIAILSEEAAKASSHYAIRPVARIKGAPTLTNNLYVVWNKDAENSEPVRHLCKLLDERAKCEV